MIITDLVQKGESELYKVYIDDKYVCLLQAETIVKNKIKKGQEIDIQTFDKIFYQSQILACKNHAIMYVSKCLKTQKQVETYLKQKGYADEAIKNAIGALLEYGYLNDKYYAECFIKSKKSAKGINYIKNALRLKGIKSDIIDEVAKNFESDLNDISLIAKKYLKSKQIDKNTKQKLFRHLLSKGFNFDEVNKVVNMFVKEGNDDWYWYFGSSKSKIFFG